MAQWARIVDEYVIEAVRGVVNNPYKTLRFSFSDADIFRSMMFCEIVILDFLECGEYEVVEREIPKSTAIYDHSEIDEGVFYVKI